MIKFLLGFFLGIAATTVGFAGFAVLADRGVQETQRMIKEAVKPDTVDTVKERATAVVKAAKGDSQ